jgi:hypothetical protein
MITSIGEYGIVIRPNLMSIAVSFAANRAGGRIGPGHVTGGLRSCAKLKTDTRHGETRG